MAYQQGKQSAYSDQSNWSNDYLTPLALIQALGPFDLDPCCPKHMPWRTATVMKDPGFYSNGLTIPWKGRVWMNPPYRGVMPWALRFVDNAHGIALVNGRGPETRATQLMMANCWGVLLPAHRLTFHRPNGEPFTQKWFPSILIAASAHDYRRLRAIKRHPEFGGVVLRGPKWVHS